MQITVPKSHLKTVDIQFEDKPGAAYQPSNIDRNNTKMVFNLDFWINF